jgi:hypothetical protein
MCYNIGTKETEDLIMKYVVEVCYGNRNEWSNEFDKYSHACQYACDMSKLAGVSEARIYQGDEHIMTYVDGEEQLPDWDDEEEDEWAEYDEPNYPYDEWGYDPYTGGFDADL